MEFFFAIAITHFMALLSPGPDFFLLFMTLLGAEKRSAFSVSFGIAIGNAIILACLLFGLAFMGQLAQIFLLILRILGAFYLFYLAYLCWKQARKQLDLIVPVIGKSRESHQQSRMRYIWMGLQSSLLNPKNWMFYSSLMLLLPHGTSTLQKLLMSMWMVAVVWGWNNVLVMLLTQKKWLVVLQHQVKYLYYISAFCFLIFATILVMI